MSMRPASIAPSNAAPSGASEFDPSYQPTSTTSATRPSFMLRAGGGTEFF